jgi:hypothetical protein
MHLVAGEPLLLTSVVYNGGGPGFLSVGVRMPPQLAGVNAWNSIPQQQQIGWSSAFHGMYWRLAVQWVRQNQTGAELTVSGSPEALANPRNGLQLSVHGSSIAFSVAANETWVNGLFYWVVKTGAVKSSSLNTNVQVTGSAVEGSITFLFVTEQGVNSGLASNETGLSPDRVRCYITGYNELTQQL